MNKECTHIDDLLEAESKVIKRHLKKHKIFQHIIDDDKAIGDFIQKYGFIMREFYCGYVCKDRYECEIAKPYLDGIGNKK